MGKVRKQDKHKANGNTGVKKKAEVEENTEAVMDKEGELPDGVTEMDEDKTSEKVQEDALKKEKSSKKRSRSKGSVEKKDNIQEKEPEEEEKGHKSPTVKKTKGTSVQKEEPKTPSASTIERPVRVRKSVERLVAIEGNSPKELNIEKGRGTALKDIPNVAYKLSRKKTEETFKLLHSILFGRRGKAAQVKNNLSRFSGFVWHDDEEKQMNRIKEKLDKCNKEKLAEFYDVLDVPPNPSNTRKEDIVAKLIEFLVEPHATTSDLLSEKEQGKKRKRSSQTASASSAPSKGSLKSRKKAETTSKKGGKTKSTPPGSEDESGEKEDTNGVQERSDGEMSEQAASEDKGSESEEKPVEEKTKQKKVSAKSSSKKESSAKAKTKKVTKKASPPPKKVPAKSKESEPGEEIDEEKEKEKPEEKEKEKPSGKKGSSEKPKKTKNVTVSKKTSPPTKKVPAKSPSRPKSNDESSAKKTLANKKEEAVKKSSSPKSVKKSPGKKVLKVKDTVKEETPKPTDYELNCSVCKLLKEVDFNTATFTDILNLLSKQYNMDLTPKKLAIKTMIQDELTRLADADEEDEGNAEKDLKNAANESVKA